MSRGAEHQTLEEIRQIFIERMWLCMLICGIVAGPLALWRSLILGGGLERVAPLMSLAVATVGLYLVRARFSKLAYSTVPAAILILGGLAGLIASGLQGCGMIGLIFGVFCVATTQPQRIAVIVLVLSCMAATLIGACYVTGLLVAPFSIAFTRNPMLWVGTIFVSFLLTVYLSAAVAAYQHSTGVLLRQLEQQRDQIAALANHDTLTGLPSLRLARDRIEMACNAAQRNASQAALLFVDLDGFKLVNDSHGHAAGDIVLRTVAARLEAMVRVTDTAARIGGDEFLIVMHGVTDQAAPGRTADKIISGLRRPIDIGGSIVSIGASIGIALSPEHGIHCDDLLRAADRAMYGVKKSGKNAYAIYTKS